jgi:hypothetical protein
MKIVFAALERSYQMVPEQLLLIDAILTLPETSPEKELQQRIAASTRRAIGVVTAGLTQTGRSIRGEVEK